jgi:hypothetical protein
MNNFVATIDRKTVFVVASHILQSGYRGSSPVFMDDSPVRDISLSSYEVTILAIPTGYAATIDCSSVSNIHRFVPPDLRFRQLLGEWHKERGATSSITAMVLCPAYQKIIAMGSEAIPLILRQMESEGDDPDHWSWALRALTSANPVPDAIRGNMKAISNAWLTWARLRYAW